MHEEIVQFISNGALENEDIFCLMQYENILYEEHKERQYLDCENLIGFLYLQLRSRV